MFVSVFGKRRISIFGFCAAKLLKIEKTRNYFEDELTFSGSQV